MRILIAGASGAVGDQPAPQLLARGHDVVEAAGPAAQTSAPRALGAEPPRRVPAWPAGKGPVNR